MKCLISLDDVTRSIFSVSTEKPENNFGFGFSSDFDQNRFFSERVVLNGHLRNNPTLIETPFDGPRGSNEKRPTPKLYHDTIKKFTGAESVPIFTSPKLIGVQIREKKRNASKGAT